MYLMIENQGIAPVESFTILGLSSARGESDKIGQFGSGSKHGILLLMRHGINPHIYLGNNSLQFYSKPAVMNGKSYGKVYYNYKGESKEAGFCTDFGAMDWDHVGMALREFISNAIDQVGFDGMVCDIVEKPEAKENATRVFVPLTDKVQEYYLSLGNYFLHFENKQKEKLILKREESAPRVFRKGVFVREIKSEYKSMYHFNFGDELKIDESRNLDDWNAKYAIGRAIGTSEDALIECFRAMSLGKHTFETEILGSYVSYNCNCVAVERAWRTVYGEGVACADSITAEMCRRKGYTTVLINNGWFEVVSKCGVPTGLQMCCKVETEGCKIIAATKTAKETLNKVWNWLDNANLTHGKDKPDIACFEKTMSAGTILKGYYEKGTVYINRQNHSCEQTMLEELAHYITGAGDETRDFQDFAFLCAVRFAQVNEE